MNAKLVPKLVLGFGLILFSTSTLARSPTAALTGTVTSTEEGLMEGVLVTVRRAEDSFAEHDRFLWRCGGLKE